MIITGATTIWLSNVITDLHFSKNRHQTKHHPNNREKQKLIIQKNTVSKPIVLPQQKYHIYYKKQTYQTNVYL